MKKAILYLSLTVFFTQPLHSNHFNEFPLRKVLLEIYIESIPGKDSILITIKNLRVRKIQIDSSEILFFNLNRNLKNPVQDSLLISAQEQNIVGPLVWYNDPVEIIKLKRLDFSSNSSFSFVWSKHFLKEMVMLKGNSDNQSQLKTGFQLFLKSKYKKKKIFLPSNIFVIE